MNRGQQEQMIFEHLVEESQHDRYDVDALIEEYRRRREFARIQRATQRPEVAVHID